MKFSEMQLKQLLIIIITLSLVVVSISSDKMTVESLISQFKNKSIFFTSLNSDSFSIDHYKLENEAHKPHKTDTVVIKLESTNSENKNEYENNINPKNYLSILVSHQFYKIFSCYQKGADQAENNKLKYQYEMIFSKFVKISSDSKGDNFSTCFKRQDYFDRSFTRKKNNMHIDLLNINDKTFYTND